jgi:prefoldin subunit 5
MTGHNQGPWTMPGPLEEYIEHFQAADKAMRGLLTALNQLSASVQFCKQNPLGTLLQPGGKWPTQDELRAMAQDTQAKLAPLTAEYGRLAQEFRQYAPQPQNVGK